MKKHLLLISFLILSANSFSQVTIGSTEQPAKAALLDLKNKTIGADSVSADKGLLLPRVWLTDINSLSNFIPVPTANNNTEHIGLMVYNMNPNVPFEAGIYYWNGLQWLLQKEQTVVVILDANNGISRNGDNFMLGGKKLYQNTEINQSNFDFNLEEKNNEQFSVNSSLSVKDGKTAIGAVPVAAGEKLQITGKTLVEDTIYVTSGTTYLQKTIIGDSLFYNSQAGFAKGNILTSSNAAGNAVWVAAENIVSGYNASSYVKAIFPIDGKKITINNWNNNIDIAAFMDIQITLTTGTWLICMSLVAEAENKISGASEPIWGRFSMYNGTAEPALYAGQTANGVYRVGALEVSDRLYSNQKNLVKGYLIYKVIGTQTICLKVGDRAANTGFETWNTSVTNVIVGNGSDPMNYIVAIPL